MQDDEALKQLKLLRLRQRDAAETILGSSHLRDNLADEQARPLLDWAVQRLQRDSLLTVDMEPAVADEWFNARITAVADTARRFNRLAGDLAALPDDEAEYAVAAFATSLHDVTGEPVDLRMLPDLLDGRGKRSQEETVSLLMGMLRGDIHTDEEE